MIGTVWLIWCFAIGMAVVALEMRTYRRKRRERDEERRELDP